MVRRPIKDRVARRNAPKRQRDIEPWDEWLALPEVEEASKGLCLGEGQEHKVTAVFDASEPPGGQHARDLVKG